MLTNIFRRYRREPLVNASVLIFAAVLSVILCHLQKSQDEELKSFDKLALKVAIEGLPEEDRRLIILRYFRDMSQCECAKILGLTQVKVSRAEKKIIERLRTALG